MPFYPAPSSGGAGPQGPAGASAYALAVAAGFVGTEAQWLASLQGAAGSAGAAGAPGADGSTGPAGPGVASGGATGQMLIKASSTSYDTTWLDRPVERLTMAVFNDSGYTIPAGSPCALTGVEVAGIPVIDTCSNYGALIVNGIVESDITDGSAGEMVIGGAVRMDTSAWYAADTLYMQSDFEQPNYLEITSVLPTTNPILVGTVLKSATDGLVLLSVDMSWTFVPDHLLGNHSNVSAGSASNGQVLTYNASTGVWAPATPASPGASNLDGLTDVTLGTLSNGQVLKYDSGTSQWINGTASTVAGIDDLTDVTITSASTGQLLKWNGTAWVNATVTVPATLDDLTDTTIASPSNGQVLTYDSASGQWKNAAATSSSVAAHASTHASGGSDPVSLTSSQVPTEDSVTETGTSRILALSDAGKCIILANTATHTTTVPTNTDVPFPVGTRIRLQRGASSTALAQVTPASGVAVNSSTATSSTGTNAGTYYLGSLYTTAWLTKVGTDSWTLELNDPGMVQVNTYSSSFTLSTSTAPGRLHLCNSATAMTVTIPATTYPIGTKIDFIQMGAGQVTFAGSGATINPSGTLKIAAQYGAASLVKVTTGDSWVLMGLITS